MYKEMKVQKNSALILAWLTMGSCDQIKFWESENGSSDATLQFQVAQRETLALADSLGQRLSNLSFNVYFQCDEGNTDLMPIFDHELNDPPRNFTLSRACTNPVLQISNISVNYITVNGNEYVDAIIPTLGTSYSPSAEQNSSIVAERVGPEGPDGIFQIRESRISMTADAPQIDACREEQEC